jgi:hypothetical protein
MNLTARQDCSQRSTDPPLASGRVKKTLDSADAKTTLVFVLDKRLDGNTPANHRFVLSRYDKLAPNTCIEARSRSGRAPD